MHPFNLLLLSMTILAVVVFISLYFVDAGYGRFYNRKWGMPVNNKIGWVVMEAPVFVMMIVLWLTSNRVTDVYEAGFSAVFPDSLFSAVVCFSVPIAGQWLHSYFGGSNGRGFQSAECRDAGRLDFSRFACGLLSGFVALVTAVYHRNSNFLCGNGHQSAVGQHHPKPTKNGDNKHYLPKERMFKYVTSANYYGELLEWFGFAVLTWSWTGVVFVVWTFANLAPRAAKIHERYKRDFPEEMKNSNAKRIIPFIY